MTQKRDSNGRFKADHRQRNVAIGAGPLVTPTAQWRTIVLDLRLAAGRWKAVGGRSVSGPSPDTSLRELAQRANAFEEFSYVP